MPDQKICDDLLVEIFLRLPVKSVFKFKCLSNTWNHLLSGRAFRNQYESLRGGSTDLISLLGFFRGFNGLIFNHINKAAARSTIPRVCNFMPTCLESKSIKSNKFINKIGYCFAVSNGVILCCDGVNTYFVCNPIKDQWCKLPPPAHNHTKFGVIGFLYEEDDNNGFSFTVVRGVVTCSNLMEMETYCSNNRYWEKCILKGANNDQILYLDKSNGCQVVGNTFIWSAESKYNGLVFVAYNSYKLESSKRCVWLIQYEEGDVRIGNHVLGESTQGRLLCAINKGGQRIKFYTLKRKLECYSHNRVVPCSEWVQIIELNIEQIGSLYTPVLIAIHPQNSKFVLFRSNSTIYWYDLELGESRSIWHLSLPQYDHSLERLLPFYMPQYWPPLLR